MCLQPLQPARSGANPRQALSSLLCRVMSWQLCAWLCLAGSQVMSNMLLRLLHLLSALVRS